MELKEELSIFNFIGFYNDCVELGCCSECNKSQVKLTIKNQLAKRRFYIANIHIIKIILN
jgi:hypothetical protein